MHEQLLSEIGFTGFGGRLRKGAARGGSKREKRPGTHSGQAAHYLIGVAGNSRADFRPENNDILRWLLTHDKISNFACHPQKFKYRRCTRILSIQYNEITNDE
jgi:hypothetical protein